MVFNQWAPFILTLAALAMAYRLRTLKDKKLIADENEFIINSNDKIPYHSIQKIDKTYFDSKGYFIITYKDHLGKETSLKLSDKKYDNLSAVLEHLVAKIT
jgi:hypothetical protein